MKIYHANTNQRKADAAILISGKVNIKAISNTRHKGHFIVMQKGLSSRKI